MSTLVVVKSARVKVESSKSGSISGRLMKCQSNRKYESKQYCLPDTFQLSKVGRAMVCVPPICPVNDPLGVFVTRTGTSFHRTVEIDFGAITSITVVPFKSPVWVQISTVYRLKKTDLTKERMFLDIAAVRRT
jgi:hypothetical protein